MPSLPLLTPLPALPELQPLGGRQRKRRRRAPVPTLSEDERRTLLGSTLGGLAYVGGAIDKPFAATRGAVAAVGDVLSGDLDKAGEHAKQLLHLIPFSGTIDRQLAKRGIKTPVPDEHIWGREVLESFGAPKNRPGAWSEWKEHPDEAFWDLAGVAADLMIAPPVLPGLMPLTKAGMAAGKMSKGMKAAQKLAKEGKSAQALAKAAKETQALLAKSGGKIPLKDIPGYVPGATPAAKVKEIEEGLRGVVGLRAPAFSPWRMLLGDQPLAVMGAGSKKAAKAVEKAYYGKYSPIPPLRSMFGATTKGIQNPAAQKALEEAAGQTSARHGALQGLWPAISSEHAWLGDRFEELNKVAQIAGDDVGQATWQGFSRKVAELQSVTNQGAHATELEIAKLFEVPLGHTETLKAVDEFAGRFHNLLETGVFGLEDAAYTRALELGMPGELIQSLWTPAHAARRGAVGAAKQLGDEQASRFGFASARNPALDVPGGASTVNAIVTDGIATRPAGAALAKTMRDSPKTFGDLRINEAVRIAGQEEGGRVLAFYPDKKQALVRQFTPEGTLVETKLPIASLTKADAGVPGGGKLFPAMVRTKAEQAGLATKWLKANGPPRPGYEIPTKHQEIIEDYLYHRFLKPALETEQGRKVQLLAGTEAGGTVMRGGKEVPQRSWLHEGMSDAERWGQEQIRHWKGTAPIYDANNQLIAEGSESVAASLAADMSKRNSIPGGLFNKMYIEDHGVYMERIQEKLHTLHTQHNFLRGMATTEVREGTVPLSEAWFGVTSKGGRRSLSQQGLDTFAESMGKSVDELFVPEQTGKVLQGFQDLMEPGTQMRSQFGKMYDMWTAAVKGGWTLPWPAFHSRNRLAGWFQNRVADVPWQQRSLGEWERKVWSWLRGKGELEYASEIVPSQLLKHSRILDVGEQAAQELGHVAGGGYGWIAQGGPHRTWNPLKMRGMDEARGLARPAADAPQFVPMAIGERAYSYVETMNRVPLYAEARANGLSMAQAKALVDRVQYDYGRMTPFENRVMRRFVFPFYGWLKNNSIYHAGELMGNPGGRLGSTIRMASQTGRMSGGQMPRWLSEQMAIPVGGTDREQTILRQFGLPFEDLKTIQGTSGRTAGRLIGQMHPAISTAFKLYGGTDPYSGRKIKHMEGPSHYLSSAGIPTLDAMFQSTPLSRAFWSYKTLTDQRKTAPVRALDLLTGMKLATYDMAKLRLLDTQAAMKESLDRNPFIWEGTHYFTPAHLKEKAGPEGKKKLRQTQALGEEIRKLKPIMETK